MFLLTRTNDWRNVQPSPVIAAAGSGIKDLNIIETLAPLFFFFYFFCSQPLTQEYTTPYTHTIYTHTHPHSTHTIRTHAPSRSMGGLLRWRGGKYSPALHSPSISCVRLLDAFDGGWCELLGLHGGHARARTHVKHTDRHTDGRTDSQHYGQTHTRALVADANCWTGFFGFSFQQQQILLEDFVFFVWWLWRWIN